MYKYIACFALLIAVRCKTNSDLINNEKKHEDNLNIAPFENINVKEDIYTNGNAVNNIADQFLKGEIGVPNGDEIEYKRIARETDDDYDDEGSFISTNDKNDHDFIHNVSNCPAQFTRSPWGKCISCDEYKLKFGKVGASCK
ncbi:uncharacterized protein LOC119837934 [Zerene cesonia]|uniref:uncharacterized protein LOC119837934 n=1 Tax=Zerene cesonia TaxID=33412 RepID=UPI0018E58F9E|nr:uncharacterized protein LOC119837934 [Zerene cesonia]